MINERQIREIEFHDKKFSSQGDTPLHYSFGISDYCVNRMLDLVGDIKGKNVIDFGCGDGWLSAILASRGAEVLAFDISGEAVEKTKRFLGERGLLEKVEIRQMSGEDLLYGDGTVDVIIGVAVLHHTELGTVVSELYRVLKKGGKAFFMEPLGHNPFLNIYRRLTPRYRSTDEKPLMMSDFDLFHSFHVYHEGHHLTTLMAGFLGGILKNKRIYERMFKVTLQIDRFLLRVFPLLSKYCWYTIIVLEKK